MQRYLLFDSGCSKCTGIAREVEQAAHGWLTARSLRDPAMQSLLEQARTGWGWEPTLLEVSDDKVRAFTGFTLGLRLVIMLGPRQALRLAKLVGGFGVPTEGMGPADLGRRRFLEQLAAVALVLGLPKSWMFGKNRPEVYVQGTERPPLANQVLSEGEVYEGFLLLPEGAPLPSFVQCAPAPILCEMDGQHDPALIGEIIRFTSIEELRNYIPFPLPSLPDTF